MSLNLVEMKNCITNQQALLSKIGSDIKPKLVKKSEVELLTSYIRTRPLEYIVNNFPKRLTLGSKKTLEKLRTYLPILRKGSCPTPDVSYVYGVLYNTKEISDFTLVTAINLANGTHPFMIKLLELMDSFVESEEYRTGSLLFAMFEEDLIELVSTIDFKFTTLENLLTAVGWEVTTFGLTETQCYGCLNSGPDIAEITIDPQTASVSLQLTSEEEFKRRGLYV